MLAALAADTAMISDRIDTSWTVRLDKAASYQRREKPCQVAIEGASLKE